MEVNDILYKILEWLKTKGLEIIMAFILLLILFKIINKLSLKIKKTIQNKNHDQLISKVIYLIINYGLKIMILLIFLSYIGIDTAGIAAAIASIFVGVGLALQGSLSNLAGGVILLILRPFNLDDYIEANGVEGSVEEIGIFYTKLCTPDNKVIYIPNGELANNEIINYSKKNIRRVEKKITIAYENDFIKIKSLLLKIITNNNMILKSPSYIIRVSDFLDNGYEIQCRFWVKSSDYFDAFFDFINSVKNEFDNNNIKFPYPIMDININDKY